MFKLLTEEEKVKVKHEYALRRIVVILIIFSFVLIVAIVGFLPSYLLSTVRQNEALEQTKIIEISKGKGDKDDLKTWLSQINSRLKILSPTLDGDRPSVFITEVLDREVTGMRLTGFSWLKDGEKINLSVSGIAIDRQALVAFEKSIGASRNFKDVILPISNLARDRNINFQIKFSQ